ncbi:MAG: hypothetical protein PWP54_1031 [Thermosipho sp. (in: thermotogales)]|nr:hypothetical protein [Thermosipho sp. (in: thermotogales)]MDN5325110.1 hypothetical protein [Thermosipho sp. (in: thermotogales)]
MFYFLGPEDKRNRYIEYFGNYLELKNSFNVEITKVGYEFEEKSLNFGE